MDIYTDPIVYAVKHRDESVRAASRSGGVFTAVSDYILENNGVVYGCIMKDCYEAIHIRAEKTSERDQMRGSKYIQSNMADVFCNVKEDADADRLVLFSGTSCQVAALQSFLGREYNNVFYVDIVCHGVPSPKVWKDYIHWQETKKKAKCLEADFRNKRTFGWTKHIETLWFEDKIGKKLTVDSKVFSTLFCGHNVLRPSCFKCPYKRISHPGDITLADFWGIDKVVPQFNDDKGVSLLLINSKRGEDIIDRVKEQLTMISANIEDAMQPSLKQSCPIPETREDFWEDYSRGDFGKIARKYGGYGVVSKVKKDVTKLKNKVGRKLRKLIMRSRCSS